MTKGGGAKGFLRVAVTLSPVMITLWQREIYHWNLLLPEKHRCPENLFLRNRFLILTKPCRQAIGQCHGLT